jgi:hypothetical protein
MLFISVAPATKLTVIKQQDNRLTATWTALMRPYTKLWIKFCSKVNLTICAYHVIANQMKLWTSFILDEEEGCFFYLEVFDGPDLVYQSAPVKSVAEVRDRLGLIVGVVVAAVVLVVVIVVVVVIMKRKTIACFSGKYQL